MSSNSELGGDPGEDCKRKAVPPTSPLRINIIDEAAAARLEILTLDVFSNLLIRKEILKNLEIPDLLRASLVCQGWRIFCREALREDHHVMGVIEGTCHDLKIFSSLVETSACLPFNVVSIALHPRFPHQCCIVKDHKESSEIASTIAVGIDVKYMSVRVDGISICDSQCGSVGITRKILKERAESLEELHCFGANVRSDDDSVLELLGINEKSFLLSNVRRLELPSNLLFLDPFCGIRSNSNSTLDRLITISQKLIEITGAVVGENLELLLSRGAAQYVREFHFEKGEVPIETLHRFASLRPTLHALSFSTCGPEKLQAMEVLKLMLESSKKSLKMLAISDVDLVIIFYLWKHAPAFENVKQLRLEFSYLYALCSGWRPVLSKFECSKYFPNLEQVCIDYRRDGINHSELGLVRLLTSLRGGYVCGSVTRVIFTLDKCWTFDLFGEDFGFHWFKEVFPNAKVCWVRECSKMSSVYVSQLWSAWSDLEEICIFGLTHSSASYDAAFMGISEEEYQFLSENFEDFQSLELVPANPSILDFQKLKKLVLQFDHVDCWMPQVPEVFMSSKVCSWILSRMPKLALEVDTFCRQFGRYGYCGLDANVGHFSKFAKFVRHDFRPYF